MKEYKIIVLVAVTTLLSGCPLDGDDGSTGATGTAGINCWDLNEDGINDTDEDINKDGIWNVQDCSQNVPSQSAEVAFNHQHVCEALANLGEYPTGCPSKTHTPPTGTQTLQSVDSWYDDGMGNITSCGQPAPNNGPLSIESKGDLFYWVVDGGFMANKHIIEPTDQIQNQTCFTTCASDADCIASWAHQDSVGDKLIYVCYHFYHSDTITQWEHFCGTSLPACYQSQVNQAQFWSARCP